jgi:hypothetical protein
MTESLWPTDFGILEKRTPISILREQGRLLGEQTKNVVVGRVQTANASPGMFRHAFNLYCAPLSYNLTLLVIQHSIDLYPVTIFVEGEKDGIEASGADQFIAKLREIFTSPKTTTTIASLIEQSNP